MGFKAHYNCPTPGDTEVCTVAAFCGEPDNPVGHVTGPDGKQTALYGTSYAVALTGALAVQLPA